jgi:prolipoprotein diacylglyceryl transferase
VLVAVAPVLGSIPSPDEGTLDLGPFSLHVYGVLLATGIVVAAVVAGRRWAAWGHTRREFDDVVVGIVVFGLVGARLYHVATDWEKFEGDWVRVLEVWKGGLSIWGVLIGGIAGVLVMCRIKHLDPLGILDALVPGVLVAQAIGRWGNWFNQELFGEPTSLPWGLEIDRDRRPQGYEGHATFHPTFLYESLYCLALAALALRVERRWSLRRGQLTALYLSAYTFGRFWFEQLRIDDAKVVAGLRVNSWVEILVFAGGLAWFAWLGRNSRVDPGKEAARSRLASRR